MYAHHITHRLYNRRTLLGAGFCLTLGVSSLLAGCGGGDDSAPQKTLRGDRYCEVLLITVKAGLAAGEVWNTYPLNDCPQATWNALDAKKLATENNVPIAMLNGPRFWCCWACRCSGSRSTVTVTLSLVNVTVTHWHLP